MTLTRAMFDAGARGWQFFLIEGSGSTSRKEAATNGCIFINDPNTPPMSGTARLKAFEAQADPGHTEGRRHQTK